LKFSPRLSISCRFLHTLTYSSFVETISKLYENIWQFMRDNWLSNRVFKSYDDLVDHCCEAWNTLVDQPWRIMSIGLRQWAHGF
jgi:hypothetical protein